MRKKIHLLIIDPQRDFCDPSGSLFVPGALRDIHVTLDGHVTTTQQFMAAA